MAFFPIWLGLEYVLLRIEQAQKWYRREKKERVREEKSGREK